jgi:hypothetical protein
MANNTDLAESHLMCAIRHLNYYRAAVADNGGDPLMVPAVIELLKDVWIDVYGRTTARSEPVTVEEMRQAVEAMKEGLDAASGVHPVQRGTPGKPPCPRCGQAGDAPCKTSAGITVSYVHSGRILY